MDVDTAWQNFKQANINKAENQTSVDDKLDVILAQQQELLNDTSRVADLVPMVTGDKAEEDALKETGDLEAEQNPDGLNPEEPLEDAMAEDTFAGEEAEATEEEAEEDNPFSFLDEEGEETEDEATDETLEQSDAEYEETDEESDIIEGEENPDAEDESYEEDAEEDAESDEETPEDTEESEEESDEDESEEDGGYISFDEIEDDDEDTKKSVKETPRTKTIKSFSTPQPMTILKTVQKPTIATSYGRATSAEEITELLLKGNDKQSYDDFEIGYGVDPHKAVEKDWAEYRLMKKLNTNLL